MGDEAARTKFSVLGSTSSRHALIFLHGWKQGGLNMRSSLREALGADGLANTCIYCFTAQQTVDDAGEEPEWFAYRTSDKLSFVADDMIRTRQRLHQLVLRLRKRHRRRGGAVALGGYSQGACMALDVALTLPGSLIPHVHVFLVAGFAMLPRFVCGGWHGYQPPTSKCEQPSLSLWAVYGADGTNPQPAASQTRARWFGSVKPTACCTNSLPATQHSCSRRHHGHDITFVKRHGRRAWTARQPDHMVLA